MFTFSRLSLAWQFILSSFLILLIGMLVVGTWVGLQIERGVTQRTAALTALYVDSLVGHHLPPMATTAQLDPDEWEPIDMLFSNTPMGRQIVSFKLWGPGGTILYSTDKTLIGRTFPLQPEISEAFTGQVRSSIVTPGTTANADELRRWPRLIRTFAPVHMNGANNIIAAAEFDQTTFDLDREVSAAQQRSWAVVAAATLAMYLLLTGLVGRASAIIRRQQRERQDQVKQLITLLEQNAQLHDRIHRAAARSTALNERFLRRLSSELHDGPCQDIGLALLRIEAPVDGNADGASGPRDDSQSEDQKTVRTALQSALAELRSISTGLWLPALDALSPAEVVDRAVRHYESKTGVSVSISVVELPERAPFPVKIALYRLLQEALTNGFRHASGTGQQVRLWVNDGYLCTRITDAGSGFDPGAVAKNGHLGLVGMRERVELLGGAFEVRSTLGKGTAVEARLPLSLPEDGNG